MEPNIPSPVCRKDGVEIHAAVPKDITEAFSVIAVRENGAWLLVRHSARKTWSSPRTPGAGRNTAGGRMP